ncbi:MAG: hypothetical protein EXR86_15065 [Gammaproteobacteria bacterium]|nr:hypothetical protein [Gammaproteobacteria bacterium]
MNVNLNEHTEPTVFDLEHAQAWLTLPWYVNKSLPAAEYAHLEAHVKLCLMCRRELEVLKVLGQHTVAPRADLECEGALLRLSARIERRPQSSWRIPWAAAALLTLATGLMTVVSRNTETSTAWLRNAGASMASQQQYEAAASDKPQVHLVFYDDITERQLRSLVLAVGAAVVEGPTPQGVYTLAFAPNTSPSEVMAAIQTLKISREVIFAEQALPTKVSDTSRW